ncbi:MAG: L,D-transpeptidase family protein [Pseudomonadota bacterium]
MRPLKSIILSNQNVNKPPRGRHRLPPAALIAVGVFLGAIAASVFWGATGSLRHQPVATAALAPSPAPRDTPTGTTPDLWDGPIVYRHPGSGPLNLILVEKKTQSLRLYRFDGAYTLIKTYPCATGEKQGKKREENDEKTPEGIYFNTKTYRDRKITVFGDRAFELNYPSPYDTLEGNGGHGIYIHGSNRSVSPNSTNGCVALDNKNLADLDSRIDVKKTPVIIGDTLPYRFNPPGTEMAALLPTLQQAMRPAELAPADVSIEDLTVLAYRDTRLAVGRIHSKAPARLAGLSRLYMNRPSPEMTVLIRREWMAEAPATVSETTTAAAIPPPSGPVEQVKSSVESWRKAWESKAIGTYIGHYHPDFESNGKNRGEWKAYKDRLNQKYKRISVGVGSLRVSVDGDSATATFRQRYRSDAFKSEGYKKLTLKREKDGWKILREDSYSSKPPGWPA